MSLNLSALVPAAVLVVRGLAGRARDAHQMIASESRWWAHEECDGTVVPQRVGSAGVPLVVIAFEGLSPPILKTRELSERRADFTFDLYFGGTVGRWRARMTFEAGQVTQWVAESHVPHEEEEFRAQRGVGWLTKVDEVNDPAASAESMREIAAQFFATGYSFLHEAMDGLTGFDSRDRRKMSDLLDVYEAIKAILPPLEQMHLDRREDQNRDLLRRVTSRDLAHKACSAAVAWCEHPDIAYLFDDHDRAVHAQFLASINRLPGVNVLDDPAPSASATAPAKRTERTADRAAAAPG
jgi:hypothetical protein